MRFSQAAGKFSRNELQAFNHTTQQWDILPFKCMLGNSGRWIGRSEDFYNRRVLLTPQPIPIDYQVVKLGQRDGEYLIFANAPEAQPNVQANEAYLFDYTVLNAEVQHADLVDLVPTVSASGVNGRRVDVVLGTYPVAIDRYAAATNSSVPSVDQSKTNVYIPVYANAKAGQVLRHGGSFYDIQESVLELNLTHLYCIKR